MTIGSNNHGPLPDVPENDNEKDDKTPDSADNADPVYDNRVE